MQSRFVGQKPINENFGWTDNNSAAGKGDETRLAVKDLLLFLFLLH